MQHTHQGFLPPQLVVTAAAIWNIVIIALCIAAMSAILDMQEFYNLGINVQYFVAGAVLIPAALASISIGRLLQRNRLGRYLSLILNYVGMVLAGAYLLHLWDVYIGLDQFAYAVRDHYQWLYGIAFGYALFWISGRLNDDSPLRSYLEMAAMGVAGIALIGLLWQSDAIGAGVHILSQYGEWQTWVVTAAMLIFGALAWLMLNLGGYFGETTGEREAWQGWLMLSPNVIGFMLFFAGPLLLSLYLSFTDAQVGQVPEFIGLSNYQEILSLQVRWQDDTQANAQDALDFGYVVLTSREFGDRVLVLGAKDKLFWLSLRNTIVFCAMLIPLATIPALLLSMILNSQIPGMKFFRAVYFLPSVAAVVGTALIWRWLYDPSIGFINYSIGEFIGFLNSTLGTAIGEPELFWLSDSSLQLFSIVLLAAWQVIGFNTVLFLAGLQGIPRLLYEASYTDGASRWQQFRYITLPMLGPTTFFVIITNIITGLQVFNEPYALIPVRPMPEAATTSVFYLYNRGFFRFEFGYASAVAWLLFALIFTVTLIQFRFSKSNVAYED
jgi:ABC-type sugar transport system permease subunit